MAIGRTTSKETNTSGSAPPRNDANGSAVPKQIDRTKSVVNQGGSPQVVRSAASRAVARPLPNRTGVQTSKAPARDFINDTIVELKRVVWPSREEVRSGTIVTIGLLIFFAIYIFGLDSLFHWLFHTLGLLPT